LVAISLINWYESLLFALQLILFSKKYIPMKFQKIFLFVLLGLFLFASCQQGANIENDKALSQIPANTSSVTAINIKQLMDKADFQEVVKMDFYQDMIGDVTKRTPSIAAVLNDPYSSGVDLNANAYFIQELDVSGQVPFNALIVNIKDKAAFETLAKSSSNDVNSGEGFSYVQPEGGSIIAWNDQIAVMGAGGAQSNVKGKTADIFKTDGETSVANNKDLQRCLAKNADISSWFGSDELAEVAGKQLGMQLAMAGFSKDMLKGNFAHSHFNFENGKVDATSTYTINPELSKEFGILFKDEVNTDFTQYIPSENLVFASTGALSMEGINQAITKRGANALANGQLRELGITTDDIAKALDGDFVVAGFHTPSNDNPNMLFGIKINDEDTFNTFLDLGLEYEILQKVNDNLYEIKDKSFQRSTSGISQLVIENNIAFLTNQNTLATQILEGGYSAADRISSKANDALQNNIMGGYINFEHISEYAKDEDVDLKGLQDASFRFDGDDGDFKIEMKDKDINSLKKIFQWLNEKYKKDKGGSVI